jgi:imidazolonepropionase-like amidohydrolase
MASFVIKPGWLIDGTGEPARAETAVLVRDGQIADVGPVAEIEARSGDLEHIESPGCTLIPGLIDGHAHAAWGTDAQTGWSAVRGEADLMAAWALAGLQAALAAGVTTVRDCGAPRGVTLGLKRALAAGLAVAPRLLACGPCLTTTGGHGEFIGRTADSGDDLRRAVRELCRSGADFIKIMATGGNMDPETNRLRAQYSVDELRDAIDDAHRLGRQVVTHVNATEGIRNAVAAGADVLAHCNWLGTTDGTIEYDPALAAEIARRGLVVDLNLDGATRPLATGDGWAEDWDRPGAPRNRWDLLADMRRAGVRMFFSSDDFGPGLASFPHRLAETGSQLELAAEEVIWRATGVPAEALGLEAQVGSIQPDCAADLVLVDGWLISPANCSA